MDKEWKMKGEADESIVDELKKALNINTLIAKLLAQKGISSFDEAKNFFRPNIDQLHDPFSMQDMDKAVSRINDAIFNEEKILIYGDYDVDGTTSVSMLYNFLIQYHQKLECYVPDRYKEGYGISMEGIKYASKNGFALIIALDCGIKANEQVDHANQLNIDMIICDHHIPGKHLPKALAILDPKKKECSYPYDDLSGCGIGFKLIQAFCIQNAIDSEQAYQCLDLVAVSIASDIVPITGENRILAYYGLRKLNTAPQSGLKALMDIAGIDKKLDISKVVFGLGPRINAAGRIGHAKSAVELLTAQNIETAYDLAKNLNLQNQERREVDETITTEALANIEALASNGETHSTVLYNEEWHKGIIGIVASRCIEKHYKPTIILTESEGLATGSARSVDGFDIYEAISSCSDLLLKYGGHKYAAGLTLDIKNVQDFQNRFEEVVSSTITKEQLLPKIYIDLNIDFSDIDFKNFNVLNQMGPFGPKNLQPIFVSHNVYLKNNVRVLKEKHLKMFLGQRDLDNNFDAIAFNMVDKIDQLKEPFSIVYTVEENDYLGNKSLQLMIRDIKHDYRSN